jgi:hypothetical protein
LIVHSSDSGSPSRRESFASPRSSTSRRISNLLLHTSADNSDEDRNEADDSSSSSEDEDDDEDEQEEEVLIHLPSPIRSCGNALGTPKRELDDGLEAEEEILVPVQFADPESSSDEEQEVQQNVSSRLSGSLVKLPSSVPVRIVDMLVRYFLL